MAAVAHAFKPMPSSCFQLATGTDLLWVFEPLVHGLVVPRDIFLHDVLGELEALAFLRRSHRARRTHRHDGGGKHVGNKCNQRTAASFPMIP